MLDNKFRIRSLQVKFLQNLYAWFRRFLIIWWNMQNYALSFTFYEFFIILFIKYEKLLETSVSQKYNLNEEGKGMIEFHRNMPMPTIIYFSFSFMCRTNQIKQTISLLLASSISYSHKNTILGISFISFS